MTNHEQNQFETNNCKCGCGGIPSSNKLFLTGHNVKGIKRTDLTKKRMSEAQKKSWTSDRRSRCSVTFIQKICGYCGNIFEVSMKDKKKKFCNRTCYIKWFSGECIGKKNPSYGKVPSEEVRRKISVANLGKRHSEEAKQKMSSSRKGKRFSKQHKDNISAAKQKYLLNYYSTEKHEKYRIRKSAEYRSWREAVFYRDNWECQECGTRSGNGKEVYLEAHHIRGFTTHPELRFDVRNGTTLCLMCHRKKTLHSLHSKM